MIRQTILASRIILLWPTAPQECQGGASSTAGYLHPALAVSSTGHRPPDRLVDRFQQHLVDSLVRQEGLDERLSKIDGFASTMPNIPRRGDTRRFLSFPRAAWYIFTCGHRVLCHVESLSREVAALNITCFLSSPRLDLSRAREAGRLVLENDLCPLTSDRFDSPLESKASPPP
jgi:hypothetical protein